MEELLSSGCDLDGDLATRTSGSFSSLPLDNISSVSSFCDFFGRDRSRLISVDGRDLLEVRLELWLAGFEAGFGSDSDVLDVKDDEVKVSEDLVESFALEEGLLLASDFKDAALLLSAELLEVL